MEFRERAPCATCGELIALEARLCPRCNRSALVDLWLQGPVADGRARYQVARSLAALGSPLPPMGELQKALAEPRPRLATGLTRASAHPALAALESAGLQGQLEAALATGGGGLKLAGGIALGVVAVALATWWALRPSPVVPTKTDAPIIAAARSGGPGVAAAGPALPELGRNELARRALASTVSLRCSDSVGAGFFVGEGVLLTNEHVLCRDGSPLKVVLADGREAMGTPARSDTQLDLALVNVSGLNGPAPALPLGDAAALRVGDRVMIVGSPVGMDFTVHEGMVSAMGRVILGTSYVQLDAKVNPGNSGGPLLDTRGRAVGIVSLKRADAEGIALALPVNYAWAGDSPMVAAPVGTSGAFDALVAKARDEDEALAGQLASADNRPVLAGVSVNNLRQVIAHVMRSSRGQLYYEEFKFKVWNGANEVCSMTTSVNEWKVVDVPPAASRPNERVQAWLDRHGLKEQLYAAEAPLRLDLCAREQLQPGVQLELQGAEPSYSRVILY